MRILKIAQGEIDLRRDLILEHYLLGDLILIEDFLAPIELSIFNFSSLPEVKLLPIQETKMTKRHLKERSFAISETKAKAKDAAKRTYPEHDTKSKKFVIYNERR